MENTQKIIDRLSRLGLSATEVDIPAAVPQDGIVADMVDRKTVFCVEDGDIRYAFAVDGCDAAARVTATLAREVALVALRSRREDIDPMRAFLEGNGEIPRGVRIGKFDYYVFAVYCKEQKEDAAVREYIYTMSSTDDFVADMTGGVTAFCKKVDSSSDYRSAGEFAAVLKENLGEEIKSTVKIGVGGVARSVSELPQYYGYARSALQNGAEFDPQSDIYTYKEYALIRALSALSATEKERYVKTVLDRNYREVLSDTELMSTVDAFFKHSLNVSEASRSMYMHRNTLIYRLDKIENLTGLNIRNFGDAMTFRLACILYKLI